MSEEVKKTAPQFDASKKFRIPILSGGTKECVVRFPTDEEFCERVRKHKAVRRLIGSGKDDVDPDALNLELFDRIRQDREGQSFDALEVRRVFERLMKSDIENCEREGDVFRVTLAVPGVMTEHVLAMPTLAQVDRYESGSMQVNRTRTAAEVREFLEPAGKLYNDLSKYCSGYAGRVPIIHKASVIGAVVAQMKIEEGEIVPEA